MLIKYEFRFDPDASDIEEENDAEGGGSSLHPEKEIPLCTCDNCPSEPSYEECCKVETKASVLCQGILLCFFSRDKYCLVNLKGVFLLA